MLAIFSVRLLYARDTVASIVIIHRLCAATRMISVNGATMACAPKLRYLCFISANYTVHVLQF